MKRKNDVIVFLAFCLLFIHLFSGDQVGAARDKKEYVYWESFKPPVWETVQFLLPEMLPMPTHIQPQYQRKQRMDLVMKAEKMIQIANPLQEILCGHHHRFALVVDAVEPISVSWYSSNPKVAEIDVRTGALTAFSSGRTTILVENKRGKILDAFVLTVVQQPDFYNVQEEDYEIKLVSHIWPASAWLSLKGNFLKSVQECDSLKLPDYAEGVPVVEIDGLSEYLVRNNVKALQLPSYYLGIANRNWKVEQLYFYETAEITQDLSIPALKRLYLPESMVTISDCFYSKKLQEVRIPASVKEIGCAVAEHDDYGVRHGKKVYFSVDANNIHYYSLFGILYAYSFREKPADYPFGELWVSTQSGYSMLMIYPAERKEAVYYVPEGIERIGERAFEGTKYLKKVVLPSTVTVIGAGAFTDCEGLEEIVIPASVTEFERFDHTGAEALEGSFVQNLTIVTPSGSAAEAYAIEHGIKYRNE